ncbi:unnamed protein product [Auanema sp. JU1783]|nr:unnamed protein product [Auanema sp. JU1783]
MWRTFLLLVTFLVANIDGEGYYCYGDGPVNNDIQPCRFFAAVIDAGSTGTRLHLYRFVMNQDPHGLPMLVEEETFQEVKPGLSSFNNDPKGAALSVRNLVKIAQDVVPHFLWERTPITLKATAGLRLLPGDMADEILSEVEYELKESGFHLSPNSVAIMSGSDEGMYSWFTLNLLLNRLFSNDPKNPTKPQATSSVAAFDLGGGSTQLTYWPSSERIFHIYPGYEKAIDFFGHKMKLFTHSFLGNGLNAARLSVLLQVSDIVSADLEDLDMLLSHCFPESYVLPNWHYALRNWNISGTSSYSFKACYESVKLFVERSEVMLLEDLKGKPVYLFSYFYDRGSNAGLVKNNTGGLVKLSDFKEAAEKACLRDADELDGTHVPHWYPWLCQDLTYIYALLHDGYGFDDQQELFLAKKIKGMEVSWGQGLSYALVNEFNEYMSYENPQKGLNETVVEQIWHYVYLGTNNIITYFSLLSGFGGDS